MNMTMNTNTNDFVNDFDFDEIGHFDEIYVKLLTILMENKDVVLFWVYLQPSCSTLLLKFTFLSILVSLFARATKAHQP